MSKRDMFEIKINSFFSAAHKLRKYHGKCERLHGHNWRVEAVFAYRALDKRGIAIDFRMAKRIVNSVIERLDHSYLNELNYFKKANPTSEAITRFIYDNVKKKNKNIKSISVWENEDCCASYMEG